MSDWHAAIAVSLLVHGVVFYGDVGISDQPSVNVMRASSSLEISLVSAQVEVEKEVPQVTKENAVIKTEKQMVKEDTAAVNTQQGALSDAEPLSFENKAPQYPRVARERGYEGEVILSVEVLPDGCAGSVHVKESSGYVVLDKAALKAVRQWQFTPAMRGAKRFTSVIELPIVFRLRNAE